MHFFITILPIRLPLMVSVSEGQCWVCPAGQAGAVLGFDAPHPHPQGVVRGCSSFCLRVHIRAHLQRVTVLSCSMELSLIARAQDMGSLTEFHVWKIQKFRKKCSSEKQHNFDFLLENLFWELTLFTLLEDFFLVSDSLCYLIYSKGNKTRRIYNKIYSAAL